MQSPSGIAPQDPLLPNLGSLEAPSPQPRSSPNLRRALLPIAFISLSVLLVMLLLFTDSILGEQDLSAQVPDKGLSENMRREGPLEPISKQTSSPSLGVGDGEGRKSFGGGDTMISVEGEHGRRQVSKKEVDGPNEGDQSKEEEMAGVNILTISNSQMEAFSYSSPTLEVLIFENNPKMVNFTNSHLPNLRTLKINSTNFRHFQNISFGGITQLEIVNCSMGDSMPNLGQETHQLLLKDNNFTHVDLEKYQSLSVLKVFEDEVLQLSLTLPSLQLITLEMKSLQNLSIANSEIQTLKGSRLPQIKNLLIENSKITSFNNNQYRSLQNATFKNTPLTTVMNNSFPNLFYLHIQTPGNTSLTVNNLQSLAWLYLRAPNLSNFFLEKLPKFEFLDIKAPSLISLEIKEVRQISISNLNCEGLRNISIHKSLVIGIPSITYHSLETIEIDECGFLNEFLFLAPNLLKLRLSNINVPRVALEGYPLLKNLTLSQLIFDEFTLLNLSKLQYINLQRNLFKRLTVNDTSAKSLEIVSQDLQYLHIGKNQLLNISLKAPSSTIKDITIQQNPLQNLTMNLSGQLRTLKINVTSYSVNYTRLEFVNVADFSNMSIPRLGKLELSNVNFTVDEPIGYGFQELVCLKIQKSNIKLVNATKLRNLAHYDFQNCPYLRVITSQDEVGKMNQEGFKDKLSVEQGDREAQPIQRWREQSKTKRSRNNLRESTGWLASGPGSQRVKIGGWQSQTHFALS